MQFAVCFDLFDVFYKNRKRQKRPTNPLNFSKKKTICHFLEMSISVKKNQYSLFRDLVFDLMKKLHVSHLETKDYPPETPKFLNCPLYLASVTPLAFYILFTITLAGVLITLGLVILTALT